MIRAFISVGLPPDIRKKIGEAGRDFDMKGVRLVEPSLIHVTLKFWGTSMRAGSERSRPR